MTRFRRWRHDLRASLYRFLGIVSPTGKHLPMRRLVAAQRRVAAEQAEAIAAFRRAVDGAPGKQMASPSDVLALLADDVARGPLPVRTPGAHFTATTLGAVTRFSTGDPEHTCGGTSAGVCGPNDDGSATCFGQQPYVPLKDRDA